MEERHRLLRFAANLAVGLVMALLGAVVGYSVNHQAREEYINDASPAIINTAESQGGREYNILSV